MDEEQALEQQRQYDEQEEQEHQQNQAEYEYQNREYVIVELGRILTLTRQQQTYISLEDLAKTIIDNLPDSKLLAEKILELTGKE